MQCTHNLTRLSSALLTYALSSLGVYKITQQDGTKLISQKRNSLLPGLLESHKRERKHVFAVGAKERQHFSIS